MQTLVTVIHLITCALIVIVVLLQSGKGAEISASFGGSSQTVFGSSGGANFFTRLTLGLAAVFMTTSMVLTWMGNKGHKSVFDTVPGAAPVSAPAAAVTPPPIGKPANAADIRGEASAPAAAPAASAATPANTSPVNEKR